MPRFDNALRSTRPRIGATVALVALLAATAAGCQDGGATASDTDTDLPVGNGAPVTTELTDEIAVPVGITNMDEWCGAVREVDVILDDDSLDAPLEDLQPIHAKVVALTDRLIAGVDVVDAEYRDDVLKVAEGQRKLSQVITDATDETAMRAELDKAMEEVFVVADGTYEWVGTTCGLDPAEGDDASAGAPLVEAASHGDVSIIVDQSPTVSDIGALGFLAARPDVELLAVTMPGTGEADCSSGAVATQAVLDASGHSGVPIGCGSQPLDGTNEWPAEWSDATDVLAEVVAPGADEPTYYDAESVLADTLAAADAPVRIVVLGPLTNIAEVLEDDPSLADRIEQIVVMGGAVEVAGNVEPGNSAEWNFHAHPGAARSVINSGVPIALVPLNATARVPLTDEYVAAVESIDNPVADVQAAALGSLEGLDGMFMWDELAAVLAVQPEVATWIERRLVIDDDGATLQSPDGTLVKLAVGADSASAKSIVLGAFNEFGD